MIDKLDKQNSDKLNTWVVESLKTFDWSMRELSRRTGINISIISKVLSGKQSKDWGFYFVLAATFNSIPEMLQVSGLMSDKEVSVLATIKRLPTEKQEEIFKLVDFIAKNYKEEAEKRKPVWKEIAGHPSEW